MSKIIAFDLDGTLCDRPDDVEHLGPDKYLHCIPIWHMIDIVNELYDRDNIIYIYTARGMGQFGGNQSKVHIKLSELTLNSLRKWGVKHHGLVMGKLHYDMLVDDKCMNVDDIDKIKQL